MNRDRLTERLWLGTAMWGWTIDRARAFALLDHWYEAGFRQVDTATNYPIDGVAAHFRLAERWLAEWWQAHGVRDLRIWIKVGSLSNERSPDHNLRQGFLLLALEQYHFLFGDNLRVFGVHWDNRSDAEAIRETAAALAAARAEGLQVGLSGIRHPEVWARASQEEGLSFWIQVKHNLLQSDLERYAPLYRRATFVAYGVNAGGLKLDPAAYRSNSCWVVRTGKLEEPPLMASLRQMVARWNAAHPTQHIEAFSQLGLCFALRHPHLGHAIVGPSSVRQLEHTIRQAEEVWARPWYEELFVRLLEITDN